MPEETRVVEEGQTQEDLDNHAQPISTPQETESGRVNPEEAGLNLAESILAVQPPPQSPDLTLPISRYREFFTLIVEQFRSLSEGELAASYAAEWLLDNDFLIFQALRLVEKNLPPQFLVQLPLLPDDFIPQKKAGLLSLRPEERLRVFSLAHEIVRLSQAQIQPQWLSQFVRAFQTKAPLTMGELWALPAVLRLKVLQALAQASARLTGASDPLDRLQIPPYQWRLAVTDDEIVANSFISLRTLSTQNWKDFFEEQSLVEQILRDEPAGYYTRMDFETRDIYRKEVEELSRTSKVEEALVARAALDLAREGQGRRAHVGYYLLHRGRDQLQARLNARPAGFGLKRWILEHPTLFYLGSTGLLTLFILSTLVLYTLQSGGSTAQVVLAALLGTIPSLTFALGVVNWVVTRLIVPQRLPKLDFSEGIPDENATLVVVPALLQNEETVLSLVSELELHYLRNTDPNLTFALLSDFPDAPLEWMPEDAPILEAAIKGIQRLNEKYAAPPKEDRSAGGPFLLIHRERRVNPHEGPGKGVWMGWERKRGKLHELNQMILAARPRSGKQADGRLSSGKISVLAGEPARLAGIAYVITLDADTILPPGGARRLVGTLAHPLNQPEFDRQGRLAEGYSILQPRVEIQPASASRSLFTRIFSGDRGLDLYTLAVSDVYQDLFGEGIYVGKGIYHVEAFETSLARRVPENALLSHDLFEGVHGRAALATDIALIENYPSHYLSYAHRMHRWIRGDWQLLPWLFPRVPGEGGSRLPNTLSLISRWKILDNLHRSLVSPGVFALFAAAWTGLLPGSPFFWTLAGLLSLAVPLLAALFSELIQAARFAFSPGPVAAAAQPFRRSFYRWLLSFIFLPFEALLSLTAILTTLYRLYITRRDRLRWTTADAADRRFTQENSRASVWGEMAGSVLLVMFTALIAASVNPGALAAAAPFLAAWLLAPEVAAAISRPVRTRQQALQPADLDKLRLLARHTWLFFEQYIGPEDHWLPPDHYQERPLGVVAHRTSPTNIGLNLLVTLGAYDLGYTGLLGLVSRLRSSFETFKELERHRGHFLNWYDTRTLAPLSPRYVSTVDSGNLAGCLVALRQGLIRLGEKRVLRWETFQGLLDSLALLKAGVENLDISSPYQSAAAALVETIDQLRNEILEIEDHPKEWMRLLFHLEKSDEETFPAQTRLQTVQVFPQTPVFRKEANWGDLNQRLLAVIEVGGSLQEAEDLRRLRLFAAQANRRLENALREMDLLHPWLRLLAAPPELLQPEGLKPELAVAWDRLSSLLTSHPRLEEVGDMTREAESALETLRAALSGEDTERARAAVLWCGEVKASLMHGSLAVKALLAGFDELAGEAERYFQEMDFRFLFDGERQVFHIGYNLELGRLDNNYYDLLASEARLSSLLAIAKGDTAPRHWLHLARPITQLYGQRVLLSWSATMFEYLMPPLLVRSYPRSLLRTSAEAAVDVHIAYGKERKVPWGISESGYYRFDQAQSYQYRAFGVPGLGYKRGLADDLVIAPYASLLALPFRPQAVIQNLERLEELGALGTFGLYEALDFTQTRMPLGKRYEIVREYMAHHQGMIFLALLNFLEDHPMVARFHADPRIQSVDLLLQEQVPESAPIEQPHAQEGRVVHPDQPQVDMTPWRADFSTPPPKVHFLSNGRLSTLITAAGGGYSAYGETSLTRWRADSTLGDWGTWIYIQDLDSQRLWSAGFQPTGAQADQLDVFFSPHMAAFLRRDGPVTTGMDITITPEADVEIRQLTLTNHSDQPRRLRLSSYAEVSLSPHAADRRHPAFNKLFIESEWEAETGTLLFRRRPRSGKEESLYLGHLAVSEAGIPLASSYESDRRRFLGRGGEARAPNALLNGTGLSGSVGATLDPIMAIAQEILLPPHGTVRLAYVTLAARTQPEALKLAEHYSTWSPIELAFQAARSEAEAELQQLGLNALHLPRIQRLLSACLYPQEELRARPETLSENRKGQPALWAYAISGDYPIILACLDSIDDLPLVQDLMQAHTYWRNRNLKIDLVFLNEQGANYGGELTGALYRLLNRSGSDAWLNQRGGIFILMADALSQEDRTLLETAARVLLDGKKGSLAEQLPVDERRPSRLPQFTPSLTDGRDRETTPPLERPEGLRFDNGLGGFSPDGREYVMFLEPGCWTPAPWINVIANPGFGCLVSEASLGYTWAENSGENRLTPWSNDPVSDTPGEAVYLRDEETGEVWSPTPLPAGAPEPYLVRHGAGYSIFEHQSHGLRQSLRVFAAPDAPVKIIQLRLENLWKRSRRITATSYFEWVLGVNREDMQPFIIPEFEAETQALLVQNPYNIEFGGRTAFAAANKKLHGLTADREEFFGRMGERGQPAALRRIGLSGTVQAGLDTCAALQLHVDLREGETEEVFFILGQGENREAALQLIHRFKSRETVSATWEQVHDHWESLLGKVQVRTPDAAMDLLLNRWMLYQALACRIWGRSAFYQSSGAYGFRDQLQDVMCLVYAAPELAREHLLRAARHQFEAGDVLHWWHPPSGRGVRTRFSDDLLWLPFVTAFYVDSTGDEAVLDEKVPFRVGPPLEQGEDERYGHYTKTSETFTLYEHCLRAIERGATSGAHGLPLMGSGDWNDGMNRVGIEGKGESVWLSWFLIRTLKDFANICERRGNSEQAGLYRERAAGIARAVNEHAWDGNWYLRAFYDDGSPLGSVQNSECQIDAIAQSWAVLAQEGDPERVSSAMHAVKENLIKPDERLILLFTPPFDRTPRDPGYIKGYLPGIRENGGQYTHAAIWTVWAFARLGQGDRAAALFRLLNPIFHTDQREKLERYRVEPYVIAADVYSVPPHTGRGGWTWYTGSAGWMYRLGLEAILGLRLEAGAMAFDPCIPSDWKEYELNFQHGESRYRIRVENPQGVNRGVSEVLLDGEAVPGERIALQNDGQTHLVLVRLGTPGVEAA